MTSSYATQATLQHLEDVTGIRHQRYDCCINSCLAYTEDTDATKCPHCDADRYHPGGKAPRATFDYIPLIHRLRLQFSSVRRAQILTEYPAACAKEYSETNILTDVWNGRLIGHLRARGLLQNPEDIVFAFHTDGVKLFKTRSAFHVWPLILTIANLPPQERFKRENIILLGIIPGPSEPTDIDSFLRPLVDELKALQHGVKQVYNAAADSFFTLKAYVVFVVADTKGRESLMGVSGTNSYRYCFYCHAWGIHSGGGRSGHVYCPFTAPKDKSDASKNANYTHYKRLDPRGLNMRSDRDFRVKAWNQFQSTTTGPNDGITRLTIWAELDSIVFPWAFALDEMHLFWENVFPILFNHWRGRFFGADGIVGTSKSAQKPAGKFVATNDAYNIKPATWTSIGNGMAASSHSIPTSWGDALRSVERSCHQFKASEWRNFVSLVFPIVAPHSIPKLFYDPIRGLIEAVESATSDIPKADIEGTIRAPIVRFIKHYEQHYYRYQWSRLPACRAQIHLLAHVADAVEWGGPMHLYSQWCCERLCGLIAHSVKNRVSANRATSLDIIRREQLYSIPFLARQSRSTIDPLDGSDDGDLNPPYYDTLGMIQEMVDVRSDWKTRRERHNVPAIRSQFGEHDSEPSAGPDTYVLAPTLYGEKKERLSTHTRRLIRHFASKRGVCVGLKDVPQITTAYKRMEAADGSIVASYNMLPDNATRARSYVEYTYNSKLFYGKLLLVMYVELPGHPNMFLALVQTCGCENEGRLKRLAEMGEQEIISAGNITTVTGLVQNGINKRWYIVKKRSAMLVAT